MGQLSICQIGAHTSRITHDTSFTHIKYCWSSFIIIKLSSRPSFGYKSVLDQKRTDLREAQEKLTERGIDELALQVAHVCIINELSKKCD